jgi:hypothetical protein
VPDQPITDGGDVGAALGHDVLHAERSVDPDQRLRVGEVGLRQAEQRRHAGVVRRDEGPVDQPGPWLRVGQRGDDDQLVGVGDDDPLDRVGVVGCPTQHRPAVVDRHDPRERAVGAGGVPDDPDAIAADHRLAPERARLHGDDHGAVVEQAGQPAAVDGDDPRRHGVLEGGAFLGAGPGAAARALVGLGVVLVVPAPRPRAHRANSSAHTRANPGKVFAVVSMSSTSTSGTAEPITTAAWAIRWSA